MNIIARATHYPFRCLIRMQPALKTKATFSGTGTLVPRVPQGAFVSNDICKHAMPCAVTGAYARSYLSGTSSTRRQGRGSEAAAEKPNTIGRREEFVQPWPPFSSGPSVSSGHLRPTSGLGTHPYSSGSTGKSSSSPKQNPPPPPFCF